MPPSDTLLGILNFHSRLW